jgi:transposase
MNYGVGLDLSKDKISACIGAYTQEQEFIIIAQRFFPNTPAGHQHLTTWIEQHRKDKSLPWRIFLEVTGVYHEQVLYFLHAKGFPVYLNLSKRVKKYLQSIGLTSKNDKLDGQGIAQMACERKGKLWEPVSPHIHSIRTLLRHRKALISSRNQFKNQLHALESSHFVEPTTMNSIKDIIKQLDDQIIQAEEKAEQLAKQDAELYRKTRQIVDSVKGLGIITVLTTIAETNGFEKFTSTKQLESYAGYDVKENSSGKFEGKTRISKEGNAHLRAAMYMPALAVVRMKLEPFNSFYQRLLLRNGGLKKKAGVAVQRKLLVLIYTLWKKDEPFDENYHCRHKSEDEEKTKQKVVAPT